jgi:glucose-1-phosphate thymidylyltransferase
LADAFIVGRDFVGSASVALIRGDNIFYGHGLTELMAKVTARAKGPTIFGYVVSDPERYGVLEMDAGGKVLSIEEKPKSNYAYDDQVVEIAAAIRPSGRGELEITDVNRAYLERGELNVELMGRGYAWLDTGTHASLIEAAQYVQIIEQRQGLRIACPEEIAFHLGFISAEQLLAAAEAHDKSGYGQYLRAIYDSEAKGA